MKRRKFMKKTAIGTMLFPNLVLKGCAARKDYDILIAGGEVYDGLGNPGMKTDVAVKDGKISKIGKNLQKKKALEVIEADGMAVAPGFIDVHSHTDVHLLVNPKAESKIRQGVTTEISGNCGYSLFPLSDESFEEEKERLDKEFGFELTWRDVNGFFSRFEESGRSLNFATLLGQGNLRDAVVGPYDRPPTNDELNRMKQIVRECMHAGVFGLSTGLEYTPGSFAKTDELIELCRDVAQLGGIYATHMRDEQDHVLEAVDEAITISRESGVSLEIAHLKANYKRNWSKIDQILSKLEQAKSEGIAIQADRYPYHAYSTGLSYCFPLWAREGTNADFVARLKDKSLQNKLRAHIHEMEEKLGSWDKMLISSIFSEKNKNLEGKTVLTAAREANKTSYEFMRDILIEENGLVGMVGFGMSEDNLKKVLAHPLVVIGSDGNAVAPYEALSKGKPHPRFYGTFPRVLGKFVREEKIISLSEAIKKMTSLSAEKFGLTGRGSIAEGNLADLVVFDPDSVIDGATFENPHQYPVGIAHVIVNGQTVISHGEHTGRLPGTLLRKTARG